MKIDMNFSKSRVMVIDEHILFAEMMSKIIGMTGRTASADATLSFDQISHLTNILIVDPRIESLGGPKGLAQLRRKCGGLKIVFLHDHLSTPLPNGFTREDADGLLLRTMSISALFVLINTLEATDLLKAVL